MSDWADCTPEPYKTQLNQLRTELEQTQQHVADLIDASGQKCGCGYDRPDDICLGHQPKFNKLKAELEQVKEANTKNVELLREIGDCLDYCDSDVFGFEALSPSDPYRPKAQKIITQIEALNPVDKKEG